MTIHIVDTCVMISHISYVHKVIADVLNNDHEKFAMDLPKGPCFLEILKHSPTEAGAEYRKKIGYKIEPGAVIAPTLYNRWIRILARAANVVIVDTSGTEPQGELGECIRNVVTKLNLVNWWAKDKMWVVLAQDSGAQILHSADKQFKHVASCLGSEGILVSRP